MHLLTNLIIMKPHILCPTCGSDDIMKNGTTRRGKQNYKRRDCGRQFVENPQWKPKEGRVERVPPMFRLGVKCQLHVALGNFW